MTKTLSTLLLTTLFLTLGLIAVAGPAIPNVATLPVAAQEDTDSDSDDDSDDSDSDSDSGSSSLVRTGGYEQTTGSFMLAILAASAVALGSTALFASNRR